MMPTVLLINIVEQSSHLNSKSAEDQMIMEELDKIKTLLAESTNGQLKEFAGMISREFFFSYPESGRASGLDQSILSN